MDLLLAIDQIMVRHTYKDMKKTSKSNDNDFLWKEFPKQQLFVGTIPDRLTSEQGDKIW